MPAEIPREIEVAFHIHVLGPRRTAADAAEAGKAARAVDAAMVGRDGLHRAQGGAQAAVRTGLGGQRHEAHAPALSPVRTLPLDGQRHGRGKIALPGCQQLLHEAAVLGGIGSIPGAMIGGFAIGLLEALVAAVGLSVWKDAVVFAILIVVLLVKPSGIMGHPVTEKV